MQNQPSRRRCGRSLLRRVCCALARAEVIHALLDLLFKLRRVVALKLALPRWSPLDPRGFCAILLLADASSVAFQAPPPAIAYRKVPVVSPTSVACAGPIFAKMFAISRWDGQRDFDERRGDETAERVVPS
eukprot:CAMPEP_0119057106 /NCGR_PEP_ID=MMETSP1178-20130426/1616_1 /TAXON_ID=33656 /ORGANISM="unid sp, Strain CCMP2000" /LENGTH=130 /DNA_ID=CAMNT_0007037903 /DNA_START=292 /DNA_END=682 /DNA_ORIENTATION=+